MNVLKNFFASNKPTALSVLIVYLLGLLSPIFFVPVLDSPILWTNSALIVTFGLILGILFLGGAWGRGTFSVPASSIVFGIFLVPLTYFVSAIFSGAPLASLFGIGFEQDTPLTLLALSLIFLSASLLPSRESVFKTLLALLSGAFVLFLFLFARFVLGPGALFGGVFAEAVGNPLGSWTDVGLFFGLIDLLLLSLLVFLPSVLRTRWFLYAGILFSSSLILLVNPERFWWIIFILGLGTIFYFSRRRALEWSRLAPLVLVFLFALITLVFRGNINNLVYSTASAISINLTNFEARPSFLSTYGVTLSSLKENPVLGAGPNRFFLEWQKHKPLEVNQSFYWNTDFDFGIGIISSVLVTSGILGFLAWLFFLGSLLWQGARGILRVRLEDFSGILVATTFLLAVYLWLVSLTYTPRTPIFALAFLLSGLFVASLRFSGSVELRSVSLSERAPRFVSGILALVALASFGVFADRALAFGLFNLGARAYDISGPEKSLSYVRLADRFGSQDLYKRAAGGLILNVLEQKVSVLGEGPEALSSIQELILEGESYVLGAVSNDPANYLNYISAGSFYEGLMPLKIPGAYENSKGAYTSAALTNPRSPLPYLFLARVEYLNGGKAETYVPLLNKALELKPNYTAAYLMASEISRLEGNLDVAVASSLEAGRVSGDPSAYYRAGILEFGRKNYSEAIVNFNQALSILPNYSNARYFLGLSYEKTGDIDLAVSELEKVAELNPNNPEVSSTISSLRGKIKKGKP